MMNFISLASELLNIIPSKGMNNFQFNDLLSHTECNYGDILYHMELRWLSNAWRLN
jgi:hypothetical protein